MAMRTIFTALVGALLVGFFLLISGSSPVYAHAGHSHAARQTATAASRAVDAPAAIESFGAAEDGVGRQVTDRPQPIQDSNASIDLTRAADTPERLRLDACCCGSIACHAGVGASVANVWPPYRLGQRMRPAPVLGVPKAVQSGVERPPRGTTTV
jgi:hypothetical protein